MSLHVLVVMLILAGAFVIGSGMVSASVLMHRNTSAKEAARRWTKHL